jgi:hypothetical protein
MIPPRFLALYVLISSMRRIGALALQLCIAGLCLDLLLHGAGLA